MGTHHRTRHRSSVGGAVHEGKYGISSLKMSSLFEQHAALYEQGVADMHSVYELANVNGRAFFIIRKVI